MLGCSKTLPVHRIRIDPKNMNYTTHETTVFHYDSIVLDTEFPKD